MLMFIFENLYLHFQPAPSKMNFTILSNETNQNLEQREEREKTWKGKRRN